MEPMQVAGKIETLRTQDTSCLHQAHSLLGRWPAPAQWTACAVELHHCVARECVSLSVLVQQLQSSPVNQCGTLTQQRSTVQRMGTPLLDLPSDDDGPLPIDDAGPGAVHLHPQPKRVRPPRSNGSGTRADLRRQLVDHGPAVCLQLPDDDDDEGDLPPDILHELTLDGPVEGPAGRQAKLRVRGRLKAKVEYPGPGVSDIMQCLEMVPHRTPMLWNVRVPMQLDGTLQDDLMEVYSPPRMVAVAKQVGLRAELSVDLLTGWNLLDPEVRLNVVQEIHRRRPRVLMMSPPCTWFSGLMNLNWKKIKPVVREQALRDATLHLEFCMLLADLQASHGRGWVFEHPDRAKSWNNAKVKDLLCTNALVARFDQCMFGLVSKVDKLAMRKRTRFMTNVTEVHTKFHNCFCGQDHDHVSVQGSEGGEKRSVWAQRYPLALCEAAVHAFQQFCGR